MLNFKEGLNKTKINTFDSGVSKTLCKGRSTPSSDPSIAAPPKPPEVPLPGSSPPTLPKCEASAAATAYLAKTTEKAIHRKIGQICYDTYGNIIKVDKTPTNDIITQIKPFQKSIGLVCYDTYGNIIQTKSNGNTDQDHDEITEKNAITGLQI